MRSISLSTVRYRGEVPGSNKEPPILRNQEQRTQIHPRPSNTLDRPFSIKPVNMHRNKRAWFEFFLFIFHRQCSFIKSLLTNGWVHVKRRSCARNRMKQNEQYEFILVWAQMGQLPMQQLYQNTNSLSSPVFFSKPISAVQKL